MDFKYFLLLAEALDAKLKDILQKGKYGESTPEQIKAVVDELEKEYQDKEGPDKGTAFKFMQNKLGLKAGETKETPKDPLLAKYYEKLKKKEIFPEEYKTLEYYKDGNKAILEDMMNSLRELISNRKITLSFTNSPKIKSKDNVTYDNFESLEKFMSDIHSIEARLSNVDVNNFQNPAFLDLEHKADRVWPPSDKKDNPSNIWVFKGDDPLKCRIMGKGQKWCISSSTSVEYYFGYRLEHGQTQYFIFDFNKAPDDPARYVNPGVAAPGQYSEWVDRQNTHTQDTNEYNIRFGINGYSNLREYLNYLRSKGVDTSIFKAEEVTAYEYKLRELVDYRNFEAAKNYPDQRKTKDGTPYMFYFFLKLVPFLNDEEFDSLTTTQKDEFLIGKSDIPENQIEYVMSKGVKFFKEYINSISTTYALLDKYKNKKELAKLIYENKKEIPHSDILDLMIYEPMVLTKLKRPIRELSGFLFADPQKNALIQFMLDHGLKNNNLSKKSVYQIFDYVINQEGKFLFNIKDIIKYFKNNPNVIAREPSNEEIELDGHNPDAYNSLKFYDTLSNKKQNLSQAYQNYENVTNVLNKENINLDFQSDPKKDIYRISSLVQTPEDVQALEKIIPKDELIKLMNSYTWAKHQLDYDDRTGEEIPFDKNDQPEAHLGLDLIEKLFEMSLSSKKIDQIAHNLAKYINELSTSEIVKFIMDNHPIQTMAYNSRDNSIKTIIDILLEKSKDKLTPESLQSELIAYNKLKIQRSHDDGGYYKKHQNEVLKTILNKIKNLYKTTDTRSNLDIIQDKLSNIRTKY